MLSVLEQQDGAEPPQLRQLDVVQSVGEVVADAGPMYLHHVRHWSNSELPDNMTRQLEERYGQARCPRLACMCVMISSQCVLLVIRRGGNALEWSWGWLVSEECYSPVAP